MNLLGPARERPVVLVVDDEPSNIEVLADTLGADNDILFATNGQEALEIAIAELPDLVLLDVSMPGMDGYAVCAALKADSRTRAAPVIFATARSEEADEAKGFAVGAVDYVVKPLRPALVRARIKSQVELKQLRDTLERLALVDGLTGVWNRRRFDEYLAQEWRRGQRESSNIALVMIDIDHFKAFNDTYGHQEGDRCLKAVAQALASVIKRPADLLARYGGEEFACVLPTTTLDGAASLAEAMRQAVAARAVPHAKSSAGPIVSASLGVAALMPSGEHVPADLIRMADECLYAAKEGGRNRVIGTPQAPEQAKSA